MAATAVAAAIWYAPLGDATATSSVPVAVNGAEINTPLVAGIKHLRVAVPAPQGYERSKFKTWDDANHDCQNTRAEVLIQESAVSTTGACTVRTGRWTSYYDRLVFTDASKLDIDHLVPLEEVWSSGGKKWSAAKREAYANDLTDQRTLVAVSAHANRSKGDRDPTRWMPTYGKCRYVRQWVIVKLRWSLSVDRSEKSVLLKYAAHCANSVLHTHRANVVIAGIPSVTKPTPTPTPTLVPEPTLDPTPEPTPEPTPTPTSDPTLPPVSHGCTLTSGGSCIRAGEFCKQAQYGYTGYDAYGNLLTCGGSRTHPRWG